MWDSYNRPYNLYVIKHLISYKLVKPWSLDKILSNFEFTCGFSKRIKKYA